MIDARDDCFDYCSVNIERKALYGTRALRMRSFLKSALISPSITTLTRIGPL